MPTQSKFSNLEKPPAPALCFLPIFSKFNLRYLDSSDFPPILINFRLTRTIKFLLTWQAHLAPNSKFDFHKYIKRSMEDDFKVVVGIRLISLSHSHSHSLCLCVLAS